MEQTRTAPRSEHPAVLTVVAGGVVYSVIGPADIAAQVPVTTTTVATPETTTPSAPPEEPPGPRDNSGLVTILGVAIFVAAVVTILVKGKRPAVK